MDPSFTTMATTLILPIILLTLIPASRSQLDLDYYKTTCPRLPDILQDIVATKQLAFPTTAAATLRLFFHDCMVGGCDASLLVSSTPFSPSERDVDINHSLPGDAFDLVTRIKTALELQCPGIVSCADILALATRNLVTMVGGPFYPVPLGRMDGLTLSPPNLVEAHLARPDMPLSAIIDTFAEQGLDVREMVALMGAHTIGFAHCKEFAVRLYNYSAGSEHDPTYNPAYAEGLRKLCQNYTEDTTMSAFNDVMTPSRFDNMYFKNLGQGLGLLATDQAISADPRTRGFVEIYAANQTAFFDDFAAAMQNVGETNIRTGRNGEVRRRCDAFNTVEDARKKNVPGSK